MEITYIYDDQHQTLANMDDNVKEVEIRKVYSGMTFVTEEGERLSVVMRDSGFEVHYYSEEIREGKDTFDLCWFEFKRGSVGLPDSIVLDAVNRMPERRNQEEEERKKAWVTASVIVDKMIEDNPLSPYRTGTLLSNVGTTVTVADQRVNLTRDVANWLLGEE